MALTSVPTGRQDGQKNGTQLIVYCFLSFVAFEINDMQKKGAGIKRVRSSLIRNELRPLTFSRNELRPLTFSLTFSRPLTFSANAISTP